MKDYRLKSGNILRVIQDENAESPDIWDNEDIFLVYQHRSFTVEREGFRPDTIAEYYQDDPDKRSLEFDDYYIFPVDAYIHSGVHLSLANTKDLPDRRWDVSTTGYVLVKKDFASNHEQLDDKDLIKDRAEDFAEGLIETWNQYLSGDVYGFKLLKSVDEYTISKLTLEKVFNKYDKGELVNIRTIKNEIEKV